MIHHRSLLIVHFDVFHEIPLIPLDTSSKYADFLHKKLFRQNYFSRHFPESLFECFFEEKTNWRPKDFNTAHFQSSQRTKSKWTTMYTCNEPPCHTRKVFILQTQTFHMNFENFLRFSTHKIHHTPTSTHANIASFYNCAAMFLCIFFRSHQNTKPNRTFCYYTWM